MAEPLASVTGTPVTDPMIKYIAYYTDNNKTCITRNMTLTLGCTVTPMISVAVTMVIKVMQPKVAKLANRLTITFTEKC